MLGRTIVLAAMIAAAAAVILASREGAARAFTAGCSASNVEYSPYTRGPLDPGLRRLPRITASIGRDRLEGFLFYYPSSPWGKERLRDARIYAGGEDPSRPIRHQDPLESAVAPENSLAHRRRSPDRRRRHLPSGLPRLRLLPLHHQRSTARLLAAQRAGRIGSVDRDVPRRLDLRAQQLSKSRVRLTSNL